MKTTKISSILVAASLAGAIFGACQKEDVIFPIFPEGTDDPGVIDTFTPDVPDVPYDDAGRLCGLFSVGQNSDGTYRQIRFSQGNLQWTAQGTHTTKAAAGSSGTWRFAEYQYKVVGSPSYYEQDYPYFNFPGNVSGSDNALVAADYTGWIDLFGWGTSGWMGMAPYMTVKDSSAYGPAEGDISGTNYDWGVYNAISNGGNRPGMWRTLTFEEWTYLCFNRPGAREKYATGRIQTGVGTYVDGCILLPDRWKTPEDCEYRSGLSNSWEDYSHNTYTIQQWWKMEAAGAVFLPAAGNRSGTGVFGVGTFGYYWSSTSDTGVLADEIAFFGNGVGWSHPARHLGHSVRLVCDCTISN